MNAALWAGVPHNMAPMINMQHGFYHIAPDVGMAPQPQHVQGPGQPGNRGFAGAGRGNMYDKGGGRSATNRPIGSRPLDVMSQPSSEQYQDFNHPDFDSMSLSSQQSRQSSRRR